MTLRWYDRVADTSVTAGTGNITVSGTPPTGYVTFSAIPSLVTNDTFYYGIADQAGVNWENGLATWLGGGVFARTTVLSSSNGGLLVNFGSNVKDCWLGLPASVIAILNSGVSAGGSNLQVQYNNSGAFAGMAGTSWNNGAQTLAIPIVQLTGNMGLAATSSASAGTIQQYVNGAYVPILHTYTPGGGTQVGLNVFLGNLCGNQSTITGTGVQGQQNVGIGFNVMPNLTTGSENMMIGNYCGWSLTSGLCNTFMGTESGEQLTTGSYNTGFGTSTFTGATTAVNCTAIGTTAGGGRAGHAVWTANNASYLGAEADNWNNYTSTSAITAAGSNVLTFTAVPLFSAVGMFVCDLTSLGKPALFNIPQGTFITAVSATQLTLSRNVVNTAYQNGVALGDSIEIFGQVITMATSSGTAATGTTLHFANVPANIVAGMVVYDATTPTAITYGATPTTVVSTTATTVVISAAVTGAGVGSGDSILFLNNQFNYMTVLGSGAFGNRDNTIFIGRDVDTVVIGQPETGANSAMAMLAINPGRTDNLPTLNMGQTTPAVNANGDIWFDTSGYMWVHTQGQTNLLSGFSSTSGLIIGSAYINSGITGTNNTLVGLHAAASLTSGSRNACLGGGTALTSGNDNVTFGYNAGAQINTAAGNTFLGSNAGYAAIGMTASTFLGYNAGAAATGGYNTCIGWGSGASIVGGQANVIIGAYCGSQITSGSSNTIIGYGVSDFTGPGNVSNSLILGAGSGLLIYGTASSMKFGNVDAASPTAITFSVQNVVAGTSNTAGVNWTLIGSLSTGSGTSGDIILKTGGTGAGSTAENAAVTALTIKGATQQVNFANLIQLGGVAFANLPASPALGEIAYVTDNSAVSNVWGVALTAGGGTTKSLTWYNGTNWTVIGG